MALKKIIHILCNTSCISTVLANTLPKSKKKVCTILVLKQQIYLINKDKSILALGTICCNAVKYRIKNH